MTMFFQDLMAGLNEVESYLAGETFGYKVNLPEETDVISIRKQPGMTQARLSETLSGSAAHRTASRSSVRSHPAQR